MFVSLKPRLAHLASVASVAAVATASLLGAALPAQAATGQVVIFEVEATPLTVYTDPTGCKKLPLGAHVLNNQTDRPVRIYGDPLCLGPFMTVQPGYGSHVQAGSGSFSVT
ncbi:hypothetical protein [Nonomuraea rhizosphaerae]|uniref:hypothetical protein n=1 Tax=Nonomuraea rhizosphaerae TaxID=2665663 RepID=UPI001C5D7B09|nr:hypothetical protein [Nonomuraea rhizosphaerae]